MATVPSRTNHGNQYDVIDDFIRSTEPLSTELLHAAESRLPFYMWPAMDLANRGERALRHYIEELTRRGIGYISTWNPDKEKESIAASLMAAEILSEFGKSASIHLTPCTYGIFDGSEDTLHLDRNGVRYSDDSFGTSRLMGCPFSITRTRDKLSMRMRRFVDAFADSGKTIGFAFADWEIDGPIEWNGAWEASKRCVVCQKGVSDIADFRSFQHTLRSIRSNIIRQVIATPVLTRYLDAMVTNYGVYPHNGYRYWYDYFEEMQQGAPSITNRNAHYREWAHEYHDSGLTAGMPVVYCWNEMWSWSDSPIPDVRWITSALKVADNAGESGMETPLITFIHRGIVGEKKKLVDVPVPLSRKSYNDLLHHLLLRGHNGLFVWTPIGGALEECLDAYQVYRTSLRYADYLTHGKPVLFGGPSPDGVTLSAVSLGDEMLVYRSDIESVLEPKPITIGARQVLSTKSGYSIVRAGENG